MRLWTVESGFESLTPSQLSPSSQYASPRSPAAISLGLVALSVPRKGLFGHVWTGKILQTVQHLDVTSAIIGFRTMKQLEDGLAARACELCR